MVAFDTALITAPAKDLWFVVPANAPSIANMFKVQKLTPDDAINRPTVAGVGGN